MDLKCALGGLANALKSDHVPTPFQHLIDEERAILHDRSIEFAALRSHENVVDAHISVEDSPLPYESTVHCQAPIRRFTKDDVIRERTLKSIVEHLENVVDACGL